MTPATGRFGSADHRCREDEGMVSLCGSVVELRELTVDVAEALQ